MCGRFTLTTPSKMIQEQFDLDNVLDITLHYNIAPSSYIPVVCQLENGLRILVLMRWGFIPHWQKEEDISTRFINARAETVDQKPIFRQAFLLRRCLIVADGFYEWHKHEKIK